tara:strand:- start:3013 stop:3618 length:606 start_codon:yes stop_codon:yes gene_type:complete
MKLIISETSPYARKCRALIREKGLQGRVQEVVSLPFDDDAELLDANPLGKVPALTRDGQSTLVDSPLICEFLDSLDSPLWVPASGPARWRVLRFQALADGLLDLTIGRRIESVRDEKLRYGFWIGRQERGIARTLDLLESECDKFAGAVDLGALSIAVALGYLDFRYTESAWRESRPELTAFFERWSERPSFQDTVPPSDA